MWNIRLQEHSLEIFPKRKNMVQNENGVNHGGGHHAPVNFSKLHLALPSVTVLLRATPGSVELDQCLPIYAHQNF